MRMGKDRFFPQEDLPYPVPENFLPNEARPRGMFPKLTPENVQSLQKEGWGGVGVITVIMSPDNKALILRHVGSEKVADGAQGFMSEILRGKFNGNGEVSEVEQVDHTISRALVGELDFKPEEVPLLHFTANKQGAWQVVPAVLKDTAQDKQHVIGFVVVLHADNKTVARINDQLAVLQELNNAEIYDGEFVPFADIGKNSG